MTVISVVDRRITIALVVEPAPSKTYVAVVFDEPANPRLVKHLDRLETLHAKLAHRRIQW